MTTQIYISGLDSKTSEEDFDILFGNFSKTVSVKLVLDEITHHSKNCAFINMLNYDDTKEAVRVLNGSMFLGRTIKATIPSKCEIKQLFSIQYRN